MHTGARKNYISPEELCQPEADGRPARRQRKMRLPLPGCTVPQRETNFV